MEGEGHTVGAGQGRAVAGTSCEGCRAPTAPEELTFDDQGRQLCRRCYGHVAAGAATKRARGADEYRHCSKCSNIIRPDHQSASGGSVVYFDEDGDQQVSILTRRVYDCSCGHSFSTWTWQGLALLAAMGLGGVFLAGRGWQEGSFAMLLFGGALSLANVFVLRDVTVRFSHRRATSGP